MTEGKRKREGLSIPERHKYYEDNKESIIADLLSIGRSPTRKKWGIKTSSLHSLEKRWLTTEQISQVDKAAVALPDPPHNEHYLPAFPEFSNQWDPAIQLKWLEIYEKLLEKVRKDGQESQVR